MCVLYCRGQVVAAALAVTGVVHSIILCRE